MKLRLQGLFTLLFATATLVSLAQTEKLPINQPDYNKPREFADLPDRAVLRLADADRLLDIPVGVQVNALLAPGLLIKGTIVSKSKPFDGQVQSVVVKTTIRGGAVFSFSRVKNADGSFVYRGRMMGKSAGDALEIVREGSAYVLRKRSYYDLVNE